MSEINYETLEYCRLTNSSNETRSGIVLDEVAVASKNCPHSAKTADGPPMQRTPYVAT
jgi:hypothetical protein